MLELTSKKVFIPSRKKLNTLNQSIKAIEI